MEIQLKQVAPLPLGIYGPGGTQFAKRMAYLHPAAHAAFLEVESDTGGLVYTDMFRSAESSLHAVETKEGTKAPGYSAHGYGLAFDVAVDACLARLRCDYSTLLKLLSARGWHCHRRDGERGAECWHFNFLGAVDRSSVILGHASPDVRETWGQAAELAIQFTYPEVTERMEATEIQQALATLRLYRGDLDGHLGPLSRQAALAFSRAWRVPEHGPVFERTLRFVAAEIDVVG